MKSFARSSLASLAAMLNLPAYFFCSAQASTSRNWRILNPPVHKSQEKMKPVNCNTGLKEKCLILVKNQPVKRVFQRGVENRTRDSSFPISRACRKFPVDHHPCVTYIDKDNFKQILRRFPKNIKNFSLKVPTMANGEGYYFFNSDRLPKRAPKVHAFRRHPGEIFWDFNSLELPFLGF